MRLFISIRVPRCEAMDALLKDVAGIKGIRPSPAGQTHITLLFLGETDERDVPRVVKAVRKASEGVGPFEITIKGVGAFPDVRRPRVVWTGAEPADVLTRLSKGIASNLSGIDYDSKPFKSHITVGRCQGPVDVSGLVERHSGEEMARFVCDGILVMKSVLGPSGAKHSVVERIPLE